MFLFTDAVNIRACLRWVITTLDVNIVPLVASTVEDNKYVVVSSIIFSVAQP